MPFPHSLKHGKGKLVISKVVAVNYGDGASHRTKAAVSRFIERIETASKYDRVLKEKAKAFIYIKVDKSEKSDFLDKSAESYSLKIKKDSISIRAQSDLGVIHAMATLAQMLDVNAGEVSLPLVKIKDKPRFVWRGLLLDSVRHFFSVETIKRQIDGMEAAKLNIFHWHLTDDQGWRFESKKFPKLTQLGSNGQYYTQDDIRHVVAYAKLRGIEVLPEIDFPGHTSALALAYPELMTLPTSRYKPEDRWSVHKALMDPTKEEVYRFIDELISEVKALFPFEYIHIGGDEVNPEAWEAAEHVQQFVRNVGLSGNRGLHLFFNHRIGEILAKYNRKLIGWDEILYTGLPKEYIVQSWRGHSSLIEAANKGYKTLLSTGFYLDQPQPASYHYRNDPIVLSNKPGVINIEKAVSFWEFSIPRKKGSVVKGKLSFIDEGRKQYLLLSFNNQPAYKINEISSLFDEYHFSVDTWMGKTEFQITTVDGVLGGRVKVGNLFYRLSGKMIEAAEFDFSYLDVHSDKMKNILGGEIALWSELIDENSIDLRLWPRAFVVAERLWSPASLTDVESMYSRMEVISEWSSQQLSLKHVAQSLERLDKLRGQTDLKTMQILAQAVEPAQYYHRHHEKSVHETYSRRDKLDRFVDGLAAENLFVRRLNNELVLWLNAQGKLTFPSNIKKQFVTWRKVGAELKYHNNKEIASIAKKVELVSKLGLEVIQSYEQSDPISKQRLVDIRLKLIELQDITGECVVVISQIVEEMVNHSYLNQNL